MSPFSLEDYGALVVGSFLRTHTHDEFEESYLSQIARIYDSGRRFTMVLDATKMPALSSQQTKRQALWMRERVTQIETQCLGLAFVFSSPVSRFVLSSLFLFQRLPCPYSVNGTRAAAVDWCAGRLRAAGMDPLDAVARAKAAAARAT
jgi:hypothetical protein